MKNNIIDENICVGDYQRKPFVANKQPSKWREPSNQMSDRTRCPVRVQLPDDIVLQLEESARAFDEEQLRKQQQREKQQREKQQREKQQQEKQQREKQPQQRVSKQPQHLRKRNNNNNDVTPPPDKKSKPEHLIGSSMCSSIVTTLADLSKRNPNISELRHITDVITKELNHLHQQFGTGLTVTVGSDKHEEEMDADAVTVSRLQIVLDCDTLR